MQFSKTAWRRDHFAGMPEVSYLSDTQFGTIYDDACALLGAKSPVKQKEKTRW